jgi:hypothetical protein
MRLLFICCNGGHLFRGVTHCPYDGWTHEEVKSVLYEFDKHPNINYEDLKKIGISDYLLERIFFIETNLPKCSVKGISIKTISEFNKKEIMIDGQIDFINKLNQE